MACNGRSHGNSIDGRHAMFRREFFRIAIRDAGLRSCAVSTALHSGAIVGLAIIALAAETGSQDRPLLNVQLSPDTELPEPIAVRLESAFAPAAGGPQSLAAAALNGRHRRLEISAPQLALAAEGSIGSLLGVIENSPSGLHRTVGDGSATFYGVKATGTRFVFVVDQSGSMRGARFRHARRELERSIKALDDSQHFFVVFFNTGATPMPARGLLPATTTNIRQTSRWIDRIDCHGDTYPASALLLALELDPDAIFFLTDGQFSPSAAAVVISPDGSRRVPIHTIGLASRDSAALLQQIADETGGTYRYVR